MKYSLKYLALITAGSFAFILFLYSVLVKVHNKQLPITRQAVHSQIEMEPVRSLPVGNLTAYAIQSQRDQCTATKSVNFGPRYAKRGINRNWPNFTPSPKEIYVKTDMKQWIADHEDEWLAITKMEYGPELDKKKIYLNSLGFTVNSHIKPASDHLPIWLKTYKRVNPLDGSLRAICKVQDIEKTILFVTVDGNDFKAVVDLLLSVTCVQMRIYFHPYFHNIKNLELGTEVTRPLVLNTHYTYGMYLLMKLFKYKYVITLEDDLEPSADFYRYHFSLNYLIYEKNYYSNKKDIFAVSAVAHGPKSDCLFIRSRLLHEGDKCQIEDVHQLLAEPYFPGWGSGIAEHIFDEYWSIWKDDREAVYDGILWMLRQNRLVLVPCSPRVRLIPNRGVHGDVGGAWDSYLTQLPRWNAPAKQRVYEILDVDFKKDK